MQDFNELLPFRHRVATYLSPMATPWVIKNTEYNLRPERAA